MTVNNFAVFDALDLGESLSTTQGGFSVAELHAMSYVARILAFYSTPDSDWGYEFVATDTVTPFSDDLLEAFLWLVESGCFTRGTSETFLITTSGMAMSARLRSFGVYAWRARFTEAAKQALDAMTLPLLTSALRRDPQLGGGTSINGPRPLLSKAGRVPLRRDFLTLEAELGTDVDLYVPAVIWLSFLSQRGPLHASGAALVPSDGMT